MNLSSQARTVLVAMCCVASQVAAQIPSWNVDTNFQAPPDSRWAPITARDVEAAYVLLRDNHPGSAPELHDLDFQHRLGQGHRLALQRARGVTSYAGYVAVLAGFATAIGDKHIWSRPTFVVNLPRWPRFIVSKRGDTWVVTDADSPEMPLIGATVLSCDGQSPDQLARTNIGGFRANWDIGAQQAQFGPWLLVDEGNPFIARLKSCVLDTKGQRQTVTLNWMRIKRETLVPRLTKAGGTGQSGYGVRQVGNGYWIALQDLSSAHATEVVKAVEQQKDALRRAAFVVLDVRGNGGGSSFLGREIARSLFGAPYVDTRFGSESTTECGGPDGAWRVSQANINQLVYVEGTADFSREAGPEVRQMEETTLHNLRDAQAHGRAFSGPTHCADAAPKPADVAMPPSEMKGRVVLLTDSRCFSACLSLTDDFRALGALHVGQTTDAATHYVDVREQYLPSGYSLFSTLMSLDPSAPAQVGPYKPAITYNGDIADTPTVEQWVADSVVNR